MQIDKISSLDNTRELFHIPDGVIYLDGNSLGLMPKSVKQQVRDVTEQQWAEDGIASWNKHQWIDLPQIVGEQVASLIGAAEGQTVCCDSISVNLFKVLAAALQLQEGKVEVLSTEDNFPTDLYMAQGLEALLGTDRCHLRMVKEQDLASSIGEQTAVLMVTQVNFRTGQLLDIAELTKIAHEKGVLVIVDLAHSTGVLPVELDEWQADFAVGCTYKYLNGGPGAPAFVYAAKRHHASLQQPLYGWMGHKSGFAFSPQYEAAEDIKQFLVGTPSIISMSAVHAALKVYDQTTVSNIRHRSMQLTSLFHSLLNEGEHSRSLVCISPEEPEQRGSQLSFEFEHAYPLCQALIAQGVIADFRAPNYLRFGFAPLYNNEQDIRNAAEIIEATLANKTYLNPEFQSRNKVT